MAKIDPLKVEASEVRYIQDITGLDLYSARKAVLKQKLLIAIDIAEDWRDIRDVLYKVVKEL